MKILITGGSGVLGGALMPHLREAGHEIHAPARAELDLFDAASVAEAAAGMDAVYHLATRIPPPEHQGEPEAWRTNDRLRAEATPILVDAALAGGAQHFVFPGIAFVYAAEGEVDESSPVVDPMGSAASALVAEREIERFSAEGRNGVVLRLGLLYGPTTGSDVPAERWAPYGATLRIEDAGTALAVALDLPGGIYNVVGDGQRVSNQRLKDASGWRPRAEVAA
jgi:nucleoside-diphosphate-sugar epimerase